MLRQTYIWEAKYRAAILESDPTKLWERIESARDQINRRLEYLRTDRSTACGEEFCAIQDALAELRVLERLEIRRRA